MQELQLVQNNLQAHTQAHAFKVADMSYVSGYIIRSTTSQRAQTVGTLWPSLISSFWFKEACVIAPSTTRKQAGEHASTLLGLLEVLYAIQKAGGSRFHYPQPAAGSHICTAPAIRKPGMRHLTAAKPWLLWPSLMNL